MFEKLGHCGGQEKSTSTTKSKQIFAFTVSHIPLEKYESKVTKSVNKVSQIKRFEVNLNTL